MIEQTHIDCHEKTAIESLTCDRTAPAYQKVQREREAWDRYWKRDPRLDLPALGSLNLQGGYIPPSLEAALARHQIDPGGCWFEVVGSRHGDGVFVAYRRLLLGVISLRTSNMYSRGESETFYVNGEARGVTYRAGQQYPAVFDPPLLLEEGDRLTLEPIPHPDRDQRRCAFFHGWAIR